MQTEQVFGANEWKEAASQGCDHTRRLVFHAWDLLCFVFRALLRRVCSSSVYGNTFMPRLLQLLDRLARRSRACQVTVFLERDAALGKGRRERTCNTLVNKLNAGTSSRFEEEPIPLWWRNVAT